jgi:hypothetical protein
MLCVYSDPIVALFVGMCTLNVPLLVLDLVPDDVPDGGREQKVSQSPVQASNRSKQTYLLPIISPIVKIP